jgi:PAS domain S-box-containing protein
MKIRTLGISFIVGLFLLGVAVISISLISLSRTDKVQTIWQEFEDTRNNKLKALVALRSEIGYGGMIHRFKNFILRQRKSDADAIISSIGGARAALRRYRSLQLNVSEDSALLNIQNTLDAYSGALNQVHQLIQQKKTAEKIDHIVKIDDKPALKALSLLETETSPTKKKNLHSKPLLLNELRMTMGYGGLIHNFKNYILRGSPEALAKIGKDTDQINALVASYQQYPLSALEQKALQDILLVAQSYEQNLAIVQRMIIEGQSARNIDRVVIVDDTPALHGFDNLQRQIIFHNNDRAEQLNKALNDIQLSGRVIFYVTLVSFLLLIVLATLLLYKQIICPISKLTNIMSRLAHDDLEIKVFGTEQDNEIGEMARSLEVFQINAIKKRQTEKYLQRTKDQLEDKVEERTKALKENETHLALLAKNAVEGEKRLKTILNTAMDSVIQIDERGLIIDWNSQAESMFGWTNEEVIGRELHEIIIPEHYRTMHIEGLKHFIAIGTSKIMNTRVEISALHRDAKEFPIELAISAIKHKNKYQFCAFIRDISDQKKAQEIIIKDKESAELANQAKSEFLANMSHELRTPMHGILSFAAIGIKKSDTATKEKLQHYFSNIQTSGKRLLVLLNDLLDLSKLDARKMEMNMQQNDLTAVFEKCRLEQEQRIVDSALTLQFIKPSHPVTAVFDEPRIAQVITNLLSNAIKFSPKDSLITATIEASNSQELCFSLRDEGVGIPEKELSGIFDAFVQSSKTKTKAGGTGLGLAISKKIIDEHGGRIWAEQTSKGGALFKFVIPQGSSMLDSLIF